ncbi:hypothetical protein [Alkaliphilus transvaalensis]|uniref:hypothetical protein n=1 Tax=Alkaliphilus transvaalensis TaxID=114628 RepID=UPI00054F0417|nr:hypothetical protein [Alkaliphilus transvaalensis]
MKEKIEVKESESMIVDKFKLGSTQVEIYNDAYKNKTKEDIEKILKRIAYIVQNETNIYQ